MEGRKKYKKKKAFLYCFLMTAAFWAVKHWETLQTLHKIIFMFISLYKLCKDKH